MATAVQVYDGTKVKCLRDSFQYLRRKMSWAVKKVFYFQFLVERRDALPGACKCSLYVEA